MTTAEQAPKKKMSGLKIALIVAGVVVAGFVLLIGVLAALLLPALAAAREAANRVSCANNLNQMYKAMHIYVATFGRNSAYPPHAGEAYFLCLKGCQDPAHPAGYAAQAPLMGSDLFECPSASTAPGTMDYRGPKRFEGLKPEGVSALADEVPPDRVIGCDKKGNHRDGGNGLRFDGSVRFLKDAEYEEALKTTE